LLAGAALPASVSAYGQCVTDLAVVDACLGGVRRTVPGGASLDLNFMGAPLDPRITFTRASTATYTDASGTIQTVAANTPRWDYDPVTHALRGLLIEEARTNNLVISSDFTNPFWTKAGVTAAAPTVTGNQTTAPDGTLTASRFVIPAVSGAGSVSIVYANYNPAAAIHAFSVYLKGSVGGELIYIEASTAGVTFYASPRLTLTTQWQRFTLVTPALTAAVWIFAIGTDLRDVTQASTPAQTVYAWCAQVEQGASATSAINTTGVAVARSADLASMPLTPGASGTYAARFIPAGAAASLPVIIGGNAGSPVMAIGADSRLVASIRSGAAVFSGVVPAMTFGAINKAAFGWLTGASKAAVNGTLLGANAVALTVTGTSMQLGSDGVTPGNNAINGALQGVQGWPRQLSDAELQQVTL
jgi:hypothetical protein